MKIAAGTRWKSAVCDTQVMVVSAPDRDVSVTCGGAPLVALDAETGSGEPAADASAGTQIGKRYVNEAGDLELLCTKAGAGSLAADGEALAIKGAKPLPSSD
ncbi:MAG TPA: hypothetical protein VKB65_14090 [Myxococcota bacterium]|nr:hypothetical protein [Myxococcota bacterium]